MGATRLPATESIEEHRVAKKAGDPKLGAVRIVKADDLNYAVEIYKETRDKRTGDVQRKWRPAGYYGEKLEWAVRSALMTAVPDGQSLLMEFTSAVEDIVAQTKAHLCGE